MRALGVFPRASGRRHTPRAVQALPSTSQNLWAFAAHIVLAKALPKFGSIATKWVSAIVKALRSTALFLYEPHFASRVVKNSLYFLKCNGAYQARRILHEATPEGALLEKNTDGYLRFVDSPISGCRRLTQVGALPHHTLLLIIFQNFQNFENFENPR